MKITSRSYTDLRSNLLSPLAAVYTQHRLSSQDSKSKNSKRKKQQFLDTGAKQSLFEGKTSFVCAILWVIQDSYYRGDENIHWKFQATTKNQCYLCKGRNKTASPSIWKVKRKGLINKYIHSKFCSNSYSRSRFDRRFVFPGQFLSILMLALCSSNTVIAGIKVSTTVSGVVMSNIN